MSDCQWKNAAAKKHRIGIKWKMYAILIVFCGIIVGLLWFFQVRMLNYFYQMTKFNELEISSQAISAELSNAKKLAQITDQYALEYNTDIWVYRITDSGDAVPVTEAQGTADSDIALMSQKFSQLYNLAVQNQGSYIALIPQDNFYNGTVLQILRDNSNDSSSYPIEMRNTDSINAVFVEIQEANRTTYMIIQSTMLTPVHSIIQALQYQSLWIGFLLAVLALLMAGFMSKLITKPLIKMNEEAKQLAQGNYNANFSGDGYREIDELADTLNYASMELAKTDRLQKELISNISHDLRTPLTMIKGYSEVMRDIPGENTPENIQIIIDETARLADLVNDMLDISRIQAGTRKPEIQRFSLTDTVRDTMNRYERLTMQKGYKIEFSADQDAMVEADRGMILQVVYNLINNAINYTGADLSVFVKQEIHDGKVRISVIDTGAGIAEGDLTMIWDRYYKVDKVHRRAMVGTGLGLSIVKEILELHHASYGVASTIGVGSTFWFELKIAADETIVSGDYIEAEYEIQETEKTV